MARLCTIPDCSRLVFRTDKLTRKGYCQYHYKQHSTDLDKRPLTIISQEKALKKQKIKPIGASEIAKVRKLIKPDKRTESKSELLSKADKLFAAYIKHRDTDKSGKVICPCCNKVFSANDVDNDGNKILQCLHFVNRDVYSLRFDNDNARGGHSFCNRNQHYQPFGKEYINFRQNLVNDYGETAVVEMELEKRKINKITTEMLNTVIEHYSN